LIVKHEIKNSGEEPLLVWIEPWAEEYSVPPGSTLGLKFEGPYDDPTFGTSVEEGRVFFDCGWGGSTFEATLNGNWAIPNSV
jgi:hypothetical protein